MPGLVSTGMDPIPERLRGELLMINHYIDRQFTLLHVFMVLSLDRQVKALKVTWSTCLTQGQSIIGLVLLSSTSSLLRNKLLLMPVLRIQLVNAAFTLNLLHIRLCHCACENLSGVDQMAKRFLVKWADTERTQRNYSLVWDLTTAWYSAAVDPSGFSVHPEAFDCCWLLHALDKKAICEPFSFECNMLMEMPTSNKAVRLSLG